MKICLLGDSLLARFEGKNEPIINDMLHRKLVTSYTLDNVAVSGNNTYDVLERLEKDVIAKQPDLVIIMLGANDAAIHKLVDIADYRMNMLEIVERLKESKVVLVSCPAVEQQKQVNKRNNALLSKYAKVVEEIAVQNNLIYIDFFYETLHHQNHKELMKGVLDDGLHMGELGYELLSDLLIQKIGL